MEGIVGHEFSVNLSSSIKNLGIQVWVGVAKLDNLGLLGSCHNGVAKGALYRHRRNRTADKGDGKLITLQLRDFRMRCKEIVDCIFEGIDN